MDYHAKVEYDPIGAHAGVFMRVHNNRQYWDTDADPPQCLNETTRFGCYMSGGPSDEEFQGAIQLDGDQASGNPKCPLKKKRYLRFFELDENPFDNPGNVYRIQITEEEELNILSGEWVPQWQAEIYNLSAQGSPRIGHSDVVTAKVLEAKGMTIPRLSGSRLAIGSGPGTAGRVDATFVATNYWIY